MGVLKKKERESLSARAAPLPPPQPLITDTLSDVGRDQALRAEMACGTRKMRSRSARACQSVAGLSAHVHVRIPSLLTREGDIYKIEASASGAEH